MFPLIGYVTRFEQQGDRFSASVESRIIRMIVHAERVHPKTTSEITGGGTQRSAFRTLLGCREKVGQDCPTNLLTILFATLGKQTRGHHEKSDPNFTHIVSCKL
jgi:hypothetical protein